MSRKLALICLCCFLVLTGCLSYFEIMITDDDPFHPLFNLRKPVLSVPIGSRSVLLSDFGVYEREGNQWNYKNPLWRIVQKPGTSIEISQIRYGKVPPSFREEKANEQLQPRKIYLVMGFGAGGHGSTEFMIVGNGSRYHITQGRELSPGQ
jgi:hypothetical protein